SEVADVAVFTVQDASATMRKIAAQVAASAPPPITDLTLCDGTNVSPCADGDPTRACGDSSGSFYEIHGRIDLPNYQAGTMPYEPPSDGGDVQPEGSGEPVVQGRVAACFALTIPKSAAPPGGWPVVVHGHGTGGGYRAAIDAGIADTLATAAVPMATFTI